MKTHSIQFKFLITIISAMLAITLFIGGLSIYEVDHFVQQQAESFVKASCEKEATQVNDIFGDMEKSVNIMSSYILSFLDDEKDIESRELQNKIVQSADKMFADVTNNTVGAVAYYLRFVPEVSDSITGFFTARGLAARPISPMKLRTYPVMTKMIPSMWDGTGSLTKRENRSGCSPTTTKTTIL